LARLGLASSTGLLGSEEAVAHLASPASPDAQVLQALGVEGVAVTTAQLAVAYSGLARASSRPEMAPVVAGLEGAVAFGTAQRARVAGWAVAGKTGSVLAANGMSGAWFAGFAPSRAPVVALAVLVHGRSGGADAAPVAARILDAWRRGRI
jgi:membrane peptidoglycan carboxypeptidase